MVASVIVDISTAEIDKIFEYIAPESLGVKKGDRVLVPFGNIQRDNGRTAGTCKIYEREVFYPLCGLPQTVYSL